MTNGNALAMTASAQNRKKDMQNRSWSNLEYIRALERVSRELEPTPAVWDEFISKATAYARRHVANVNRTPAYALPEDKGAGILTSPISEEGISLDQALSLLYQNVDQVGVNSGSGRCLGYIPSGGLVHSAFGDFLAAISNRYAGVFDASPGAVRMENMLIRWMADVAGYPSTAGGYLASGGSLSNLSAIVAAREEHDILADNVDRVVVYVTEHTHHCVDKALRIAGLGRCQQRKVNVDRQLRMSAESLGTSVEADRAAGLRPWLVVGSAGTTNTGTVDPLRRLHEIAREYGLWFHIDGAYGGFFALCPEGEYMLDGMDLSDSLVLDPHKTLFLPFGTGALLVRDRAKLGNSHGGLGTYMMDLCTDPEEPSPAYLSPELTKHFRGLRMWLPLKVLGVAPFRAALSEKIRLARYFYSEIQKVKGFQVGPYPDLSIVTYRFVPPKGDVNEFNLQLVRRTREDGRIFVTSTVINGKVVLRLAVGCFRTHLEDVDLALTILKETAEELAAS